MNLNADKQSTTVTTQNQMMYLKSFEVLQEFKN